MASGGSEEEELTLLPETTTSAACPEEEGGKGHASLPPPGPSSGIVSTSSSPGGLDASDQALYGLVVHSAADGLAVGASCLSGSLSLTASVCGAIFLHKVGTVVGEAVGGVRVPRSPQPRADPGFIRPVFFPTGLRMAWVEAPERLVPSFIFCPTSLPL